MLAGVQCLDGDDGVKIVGCRDVNGVNVRVGDQIGELLILLRRSKSESFDRFIDLLRNDVAKRNDLDIFHGLVSVHMDVSHSAEPDETYSESFHILPPLKGDPAPVIIFFQYYSRTVFLFQVQTWIFPQKIVLSLLNKGKTTFTERGKDRDFKKKFQYTLDKRKLLG